jgi:transcriptional regulator with XRE-family HTH domain
MDRPPTPSDVVAARVRQVRKRRELTVPELAERCAAIGAPQLTAQAIYKIEGQRESATRSPRQVTVDELLALAAALNVAPVHLLVPVDDVAAPYDVTATVNQQAWAVREWIRGTRPLFDDDDPREFYTEIERGRYWHPEYGITGAAGGPKEDS